MSIIDTTSPIVFFDGMCNLCNRFVQFIIRHDKKKTFRFSSLQSQAGQEALKAATLPGKTAPDSVVLFYKGLWYTQSAAALLVLKLLGWPWAILYTGIIVPRPLRDIIYNFVARNRYKWFGKHDACMIPTPDIMDRFL